MIMIFLQEKNVGASNDSYNVSDKFWFVKKDNIHATIYSIIDPRYANKRLMAIKGMPFPWGVPLPTLVS